MLPRGELTISEETGELRIVIASDELTAAAELWKNPGFEPLQ